MVIYANLRKIFGFTRSGTSVLGKHALRLISVRRLGRSVGITLVATLTAITIIHNFANVGGSLVLAVNTPKAVVDAATVHTVQSPIDFTYESRGFSWFHSGADLVAPTGTPVFPIMPGTVETVAYDPFGFGIHVIVKHDEGYESIYGHLSKTEVKEGQMVDLSTELGKSGSTGFSTGPHLHIEVHLNGVPVNPADIVPGVK